MSELIKTFLISTSIFSKSTTHTEIDGFFSSLKGSANKLVFKESSKSALGEFIERYGELTVPPNQVAALNIITCRKTLIPAKQVFLLRRAHTRFNTLDFFDSSGTAYHTSIEKSIEKAFFEFIERQSLVYSYLRKWPGRIINKKTIENELKKYKKYNFSCTFINDISIVKGIHVIIFVGITKNTYNVGIGTDYNLLKAVQSALSESIGATQFFISDSEIKKREASISNVQNINDFGSYENIFFEKLTPNFIYNSFAYLNKSSAVLINNESYFLNSKLDVLQKIKIISKELPVEPCISFLSSNSYNIKGQIVHFSAKGAYPHIFTPFINPQDFKISYCLHKSEVFPNQGNYLPFP